MSPEIVADYPCRTGERPLWHAAERRLYWTDIPAGKMYRLDPATGQHEQVYEGRPVGGFTIQSDGSLLLFMDRGTVATWRAGSNPRIIVEEIPQERDSRFNDVIADPEGRVYCGAMGVKDAQGQVVRNGRLYRLDRDGTITQLLDDVATSNGMGFTLDGHSMFHTETGRRTIWQFDYDRASGAITNRREFVTLPQQSNNARPDGLAIDDQGRLWSAQYDGGCVICFSSQGIEQQRLEFPTPRITCPTFGGDALDELYVTSGGGDDRAKNGPAAGALFRLRGIARGRPEFLSRVGL